MRYITIFLLLVVLGCAGHKQPAADYMTTEALKLGLRLNISDFVINPVESYFTPQELDWFEANKSEAQDIIIEYIYQNSTPAVMLAGYLRLDAALEPLRFKFLTLRNTYGFEGPDYTQEEAWLGDFQYPYHTIYIDAIERITQKPIHESIQLTPDEYNYLLVYSELALTYDSHPDVGPNPPSIDRKAWCAQWLLIKLKLLEGENLHEKSGTGRRHKYR